MARPILLMVVLLVLVGVRAGVAQQATEEDFRTYQHAMEGRWVGDVTWIADWPGLGKKGDKITAYSEFRAVADGRALAGRFYGGSGAARWITVFDAAARQIRETGSDSGGRTWNCVFSREDEHWKSRCSGSLADGTKFEGDTTLTISGGGNTHKWTGSVTIGGKAADPLRDVWTRVGR